MVKSKFLALAVIALALLILVPSTMAASKTPPSVQEILGWYDVKFKYTGYDVGPFPYKGSYGGEFLIQQSMGPGNVILNWYDDFGTSWQYPAIYENGVLVFAMANDEEDPPEWIEMMIAQFSGSGDKIKMSGSAFFYNIRGGWAEEDSFSAKKIPQFPG